eukprot:TRINITY_DN3260_c0_g1_i1.p1 TRINITY_DN3260_c0_g1~~TRINITY_DN3260_c0_g1_i1.p1  ORF type:complete len:243 (-),score=47.95 TRINITY_DN3260_c0_g1_i1:34-762(-)
MGLLRSLLEAGCNFPGAAAPEAHQAEFAGASSSLATAFVSPDAGGRRVTSRVFLDLQANGKQMGRVTFGLFGEELPKTVANFEHLAKCDVPPRNGTEMCYRGSRLHRIIPGFMLQGGDFTNGNGTGGMSIYGRNFPDETGASGEKFPFHHDRPYLLSMANAGPDTNGSQFFITTAKTPWLDGHHTVLGEVQSGEKVVKAIEAMGSPSGEVNADVRIVDSGLLPAGDGNTDALAGASAGAAFL